MSEQSLSLSQLTEQITKDYSQVRSFVVPAQRISMTEDGLLDTGKNNFPLTPEASEQIAHDIKSPKFFFQTLERDIQAELFNRRFSVMWQEYCASSDLRFTLNKKGQIIGYDDPRLLRINPVTLMEVVNTSVPESLSAEQVMVSRLYLTNNKLSFSCFSPEIIDKPRVDDIINADIDVHHSTSGEFGTQVRCYLRRLSCENGACTHICKDEKHLRARRLSNGRFDQKDMVNQLHRLFTEAWAQLDEKLQAVRGLLDKEKVSIDFLQQQRTRFSLNNEILREIEIAVNHDELGPTNTQYDIFNAISRIATHSESLSLRQRRRLMFMAGEFSQQDVHRCSQCGSWVVSPN